MRKADEADGRRQTGDTETRRYRATSAVTASPCLRVSVSRLLALAFLLTAFCLPAFSQPGAPGPSSPLYGARPESGAVSSGLPKALREVRIDQKLNEQLPLDLVFRNENGEPVKLGDYFGKKPVVLSLVYYECPMLCTQVLNGMVSAFKVLSFKAGDEFDVVTVSFDPRETSALATAKKKTYVDYLPEAKRGTAAEWLAFPDGRQRKHQTAYGSGRLSLSLRRSDEPVCSCQRNHDRHARGQTRALFLRHRVFTTGSAFGADRGF